MLSLNVDLLHLVLVSFLFFSNFLPVALLLLHSHLLLLLEQEHLLDLLLSELLVDHLLLCGEVIFFDLLSTALNLELTILLLLLIIVTILLIVHDLLILLIHLLLLGSKTQG